MVKFNDILVLEIVDMNYLGKGVGKVDDFVVFVEGAVIGDIVKVEVIEVKKSYALANILEIESKSNYRTTPQCDHFSSCGGCLLMMMDYKKQLEFKRNNAIAQLIKAGVALENTLIKDTVGMEIPYRYRNKTAFNVKSYNESIIIGTYEQGTHKTVDIDRCMIQSVAADRVVNVVKQVFLDYRVKPFDKKTNTGNVKHIVIRTNKKAEIMLIIVTKDENISKLCDMAKEIVRRENSIKTIIQNINGNTRNILGNKNNILYGDGTISEFLGELEFVLSPHTFFQVNTIQTEILYNIALEFAALEKDDICFDLYCGIGTISLLAATRAKKVYGIEVVEQSIEDANKNKIRNKVDNADFYVGRVEKTLPKLAKNDIYPDVVILDPPRKGCEIEVLEEIVEIAPKTVVYVSCNAATLGRDIKVLQDNNYLVAEIQPVDMFCHSTHTEVVAKLVKITNS